MGLVFFCKDKLSQKTFVLKTFKPEVINDQIGRLRFLQEVCDWIFLGSHPNLVQAYRLEQLGYPPQPYLVLESIEGKALGDDVSLTAILDSLPNRQLPIQASLKIALDVSRAMLHADKQIKDFMHCDIKPSNILLDAGGNARLTDLGLTSTFSQRDEALSEFISQLTPEQLDNYKPAGSPQYIAPEQWQPNNTVDARADIYSLGLVLYEMLTGMKRAEGDSYKVLRNAHMSGSLLPIPGQMPAPLSQLIKKSAALNPDDRFTNWSSFEAAIGYCYEQLLNKPAPTLQKTKTKDNNAESRTESYLAIADSYQNLGLSTTALEYNQAALEGTDHNTALHLKTLLQASQLNEAIDKRGLALSKIQKAIELATKLKDQQKLLLDALIIYASLLSRDGQINQALSTFTKALTLAEELDDSLSTSIIHANIANAHAEGGNFNTAIDCFKQQLSILEKNNDSINIGKCLGNMAVAYIEIGDYEEAIKGLNKSLAIAKQHGDIFSLSHALKHLYQAYLAKNDLDKAREYLKNYQDHSIQWQDQKELNWANDELTKIDMLETPH